MRIRVSVLALLFFAVVSSIAYAQGNAPSKDPIPSGRNASATSAMRGALSALGGTQNISNLGACEAKGTVTDYFPDTNTGTFRWVNSGNNYRYETTTGSDIEVAVSNGGEPATTLNGETSYWPAVFSSFFADAPYLVAARLLLHYNDTAVSASIASEHKSFMLRAPNNTLVVRTGYSDSSDPVLQIIERDWEINLSSGLPKRLHVTAPGYPKATVKREIDYVYSTYSNVNGVMVPTTIEMKEYGVRRKIYNITSVQCGVTVDASEFTVAGGAQ